MKKAEVEKLVGRSIIVTVIILCAMLGTTIIKNGYSNALALTTTSKATVVISVLFAILAIVLVFLGIFKKSEYYIYATGAAVVAIFVMLLKINYEIKALQFTFGRYTIKFYIISIGIFALLMLLTWIRTTIKLIRD